MTTQVLGRDGQHFTRVIRQFATWKAAFRWLARLPIAKVWGWDDESVFVTLKDGTEYCLEGNSR